VRTPPPTPDEQGEFGDGAAPRRTYGREVLAGSVDAYDPVGGRGAQGERGAGEEGDREGGPDGVPRAAVRDEEQRAREAERARRHGDHRRLGEQPP
jgi:hypothetical protein